MPLQHTRTLTRSRVPNSRSSIPASTHQLLRNRLTERIDRILVPFEQFRRIARAINMHDFPVFASRIESIIREIWMNAQHKSIVIRKIFFKGVLASRSI